MKKILITILCVCCFVPSQADAAEVMGIYVTPKLTYSFLNNDVKLDDDIDPSLSLGGQSSGAIGGAIAIGYDFKPTFNVPVRAEIEYAFHGDFKDSKSTIDRGDSVKFTTTTHIQTLFLNAYFDFHNSTKFIPYVGAGLGVAFIGSDIKGKEEITGDIAKLSASTKSNFAWNVGLGTAYAFTENIAIDLGYRYSQFGQSKSESLNGIYGNVKNNSAHEIMLGARITF